MNKINPELKSSEKQKNTPNTLANTRNKFSKNLFNKFSSFNW